MGLILNKKHLLVGIVYNRLWMEYPECVRNANVTAYLPGLPNTAIPRIGKMLAGSMHGGTDR